MGSLRRFKHTPFLDWMRSIWLFSDCSAEEIRFIDSLCTWTEVPEGRTLVRQGDCSRQFLVSARGTAVAVIDHRPVALIEAGSFFGDMALFGVRPYRATVTSATHMELLVFSRLESMQLFESAIPSVQEKMSAILDERSRVMAELALHPQESTALDDLRTLPALQRA